MSAPPIVQNCQAEYLSGIRVIREKGADSPCIGGEEGVQHLAGQTLQYKLDGKDVDDEDCSSRYLVIWLAESFMKEAKGEESSQGEQGSGLWRRG